ncbi:MAG TPA: chromate efflux transporter, partial [Steroidobacteraceae bacterium]|nr:chromate efflux transporter [Steroidobacteraceae bacterium]
HYGALVALCQILPGPTSSQVGFLIGLHRAGWPGALGAWLGFTLPSALLMYAGAVLSARPEGPLALAVVHGLKLVAVAVVAQAVWTMARRLCTDIATWLIGVSAALLLLLAGGTAAQLGALAGAAVAGLVWCRPAPAPAGAAPGAVAVPGTAAWPALGVFLLLLVGLPLLAWRSPHGELALAEVFYRSGALVFGGGHVVLPLLRDSLVPQGWLSDDRFLAGYGLAQAMPGPLFSVAAYLGAVATRGSVSGALIALVCIFLPGLLLAVAGVSLWGRLAAHRPVRAAMSGVNAAVVGILAAALYDPVWVSAVRDGADVAVAAAGLALLVALRAAPLVLVVLCTAYSVLRAVH